MKNITIAGTIGRDAETRQAGQTNVTGFSVAVDERGRDGNKSTVWFDVSIWGQRGDKVRQYITKGGKIAVCGELSTREHNGKTYLQVNADNFTLQGGGNRDGSSQQSSGGQQSGYGAGGQPGGGMDDGDSIPFIMEWRG